AARTRPPASHHRAKLPEPLSFFKPTGAVRRRGGVRSVLLRDFPWAPLLLQRHGGGRALVGAVGLGPGCGLTLRFGQGGKRRKPRRVGLDWSCRRSPRGRRDRGRR